MELVHELGIPLDFPAEVRAEVAALDLRAALSDPALEDWTSLPFVTIDAKTSRDLDQALHVERTGTGYLVRYAIADAAHFVRKRSALFAEAMARGASVYFPGFSLPMLPRELSEGIVSLNPDGPRRALSFLAQVEQGVVTRVTVSRTIIESRAKLAWEDVQSLYDAPETSALRGTEYEGSLRALAEVGAALMADARRRDVASYRRNEGDIVVSDDGERLEWRASPRLAVERYNEQLSLLVNREGARLLAESPLEHVEPIYRIHPAPADERMRALEETIDQLVSVQKLDDSWRFRPAREPLTEYLLRLPQHGNEGRVADAIHRQAIVVNARSSFSPDRGGHHGVGAEAYARFSAPMREIVGVFVHHEMLEALTASGDADPTLRARVVESANQSRDLQRKVNDRVFRLFLDHFLQSDLALPPEQRPRRIGTVMGITSAKLHVTLDDPRVDLKLYLRDLGRARAAARGQSQPLWLEVADSGATLRERGSGQLVARVGDPVHVVVEGRDAKQDRWMLQLVEEPG